MGLITARKRSLRRLCFYRCLSFCPQGGGMRGCSGGACMVAPCMRGCSGGACMVALGGHAWLLGGACVVLFGRGCVHGFIWQGGTHGFIWGGMCGFIQQGGVRGFIWGVCMVLFGGHAWFYLGGHVWFYSAGGRAWFYLGGVHGFIWGACMVLFGGHVWFYLGGRAWFYSGGACMVFSVFFEYNEIRSMSGRYASYWNAFLFGDFLPHFCPSSFSSQPVAALCNIDKSPLRRLNEHFCIIPPYTLKSV